METFSTLLAICAGNSLVTGEFPAQRPVTRSFDVFFDLINSWINNHEAGDLSCHRAHYDVTVMNISRGNSIASSNAVTKNLDYKLLTHSRHPISHLPELAMGYVVSSLAKVLYSNVPSGAIVWKQATHWCQDKMAAIFLDNIFKCIFFTENVWILIEISLNFVPQVMTCGTKFSEISCSSHGI